MSRMGFSTPAQIAAAIAFIGSDESAYTTGADPVGRRGPDGLGT
jgi:hypothetical protein